MPYIILFIILMVALIYFFAITRQEYNKLNSLRSKKIDDISEFEDFKIEITGAELKIGDTIIKPKKITIQVDK